MTEEFSPLSRHLLPRELATLADSIKNKLFCFDDGNYADVKVFVNELVDETGKSETEIVLYLVSELCELKQNLKRYKNYSRELEIMLEKSKVRAKKVTELEHQITELQTKISKKVFGKNSPEQKQIQSARTGIGTPENEVKGLDESKIILLSEIAEKYTKDINYYLNRGLPAKVESYLERALIYYQIGRYHDAIEDFNQITLVNTSDLCSYMYKIVAFLKCDEYTKALHEIEKITKIDNLFLNVKLMDLCFNDYNNLSRKAPGEIELRSCLFKINSTISDAFNYRGIALARMQKNDQALKFLQIAEKFVPANGETMFGLGLVYSNQNDYHRALNYFNKAIQLNYQNANVYYNRATIFLNLKQYENAQKDFNEALIFEPTLDIPSFSS